MKLLSAEECDEVHRRFDAAIELRNIAKPGKNDFLAYLPRNGLSFRLLPKDLLPFDNDDPEYIDDIIVWRDAGIENLLHRNQAENLIAWGCSGDYIKQCVLTAFNEKSRYLCKQTFIATPIFFCAPNLEFYMIFNEDYFCTVIGSSDLMLELDSALGGYDRIRREYIEYMEDFVAALGEYHTRLLIGLADSPEARPPE